MKNDFYGRIAIVFCAVAGCLTGYGIDAIAGTQNSTSEYDTKDNTLLREEYDGVFFDGMEEVQIQGEDLQQPTPTLTPVLTIKPVATPVATVMPTHTVTPEPVATPVPADAAVTLTPVPPETPVSAQVAIPTPIPVPTRAPTLASGFLSDYVPENIEFPTPTTTKSTVAKNTPVPTESPTEEVFTYPSEIFGQTPVVNRSDSYVTYFEFAMDLIELLEPEIRREDRNETTLFTKFMLKALFCGIDVQKVKLNDPIPRDVAALAIHLAAQVMDKPGVETGAASASDYVSDVKACSSAERKAIAYLYRQGILNNAQGKAFYPEQSLSETEGKRWMEKTAQVW